MRVARLIGVQAVLLGPFAFVIWVFLGTRSIRALRFSLDTLAAMGAATALTALFLLVVATPLQLAIRGQSALLARLAAGMAAGPLGVWLGLLIITSYPVNFDWYVHRAWALHTVYAGVGLCFGFAWHAGLRPNNSFKPKPLRGSA